MEEINGMVPVDMTDHEFATFLRKEDPDWTWDSIADFNRFINRQGEILAIVKYKNDYPLARWIWINKHKISGHIIIHHKEREKAYCAEWNFPCNWEPMSVIYEDEGGTYWLKSDLRKEGKMS
jgi:hypothetical protein